jgi:hypothetical protein
MSIGGDVYKKLLKILEPIEQAIHSGADFTPSLLELESISELFRMNHKVSFDFLTAHDISKQEKLRRLQKVITLIYKLEGSEEERQKAAEDLSKYR